MGAATDIPVDVCAGPVSLGSDRVDVVAPVEVLRNFDSKVFRTVNLSQVLTMESVGGVYGLFLFGDPQEVTLFHIESHLPLSFPALQSVKVFLEDQGVLLNLDRSVEGSVVGKEAD